LSTAPTVKEPAPKTAHIPESPKSAAVRHVPRDRKPVPEQANGAADQTAQTTPPAEEAPIGIANLPPDGKAKVTHSGQPAFEMASIQPSDSGRRRASIRLDRMGGLTMENEPLRGLIERAYGVFDFQVLAQPWMNDVRFDIVAKCPPDTNQQELSLMLRRLLEERLKLVVHHDWPRLTGFALLVAKGGFRLKPVDPGAGGSAWEIGISNISARKTSIKQLADGLSRILGKIVIDDTGIDGVYDFEVKMRAVGRSAEINNPDYSGLFKSLWEMGLRLQPRTAPVDFVVVDHVERTATENE
jgi:uncharacterized protein (TIGR03435 family)